MKATELRIGNWVFSGEDLTKVEKIDFYGINEDRIMCSYDGVFNKPFVDEDMIQPIPLTEEWLVKFGFEGHDYTCPENGTIFKNETYTLKLDSYSKIEVNTDFSFGIDSLRGDESVCFSNDILESVHRLQNLYFALTGEELTLQQ